MSAAARIIATAAKGAPFLETWWKNYDRTSTPDPDFERVIRAIELGNIGTMSKKIQKLADEHFKFDKSTVKPPSISEVRSESSSSSEGFDFDANENEMERYEQVTSKDFINTEFITATSVCCERSFSRSKLFMSALRSSMAVTQLETLMLLYWNDEVYKSDKEESKFTKMIRLATWCPPDAEVAFEADDLDMLLFHEDEMSDNDYEAELPEGLFQSPLKTASSNSAALVQPEDENLEENASGNLSGNNSDASNNKPQQRAPDVDDQDSGDDQEVEGE